MRNKLFAVALLALTTFGAVSPVLARIAETFRCVAVEDETGGYYVCYGSQGSVVIVRL